MRSPRGSVGLALIALAVLHAHAHAQRTPFPDWVHSVEALRDELPAYVSADEHAPRRGTIMLGAHLPIAGRVFGAGCGDGSFVQLAEEAFVCERDVRPAADTPDAIEDPARVELDLPHEYLQTVREGTRAYAGLDDYGSDEYATVLGKGFAVAVAKRVQHDGVSFVRTLSGYYLPERALKPVAKSDFGGVTLGDDGLAHIAWIARDGAEVLDRPGGAVLRRAVRLERVDIAADLGGGLLSLQGGGVIEARAVLRPELQTPPPELSADERWIDVDVERQLLVAYDGMRPVFATVISPDRNTAPALRGGAATRDSAQTRTPRGVYRIWIKLRDSDMQQADRPPLEQSYALEQVPWVQYFKDGYGMHAAFWHDRFGERHSRGCVNLSPRDARTLFHFTRPTLPPGWFAIRPTQADPSTAVNVR